MHQQPLRSLVTASFAVIALTLTAGSAAQAPPGSSEPRATRNAPQASMPGHDMHGARAAGREAEDERGCPAMMAEMQEMQRRFEANDARLDELVAVMQAAEGSKEAGALEQAMAAVISELVAQQKASHATRSGMKPGSGAQEMHPGEMHGAKGSKGCPMMKMAMTHEAEPKDESPEN